MERIQKVTSKGQITLPIDWRRKVKTDTFVVNTNGSTVEISPVKIKKDNNGWYNIFDAKRDNRGKGIKAKTLLKKIRKMNASR